MTNWKVFAIGAGVIAIGGAYVYKLYQGRKQVTGYVSGKIHGISGGNLVFNLTLHITNPSAFSATIKQPVVELIYHGHSLARSRVQNVDRVIPKYGELEIKNIMLEAPLLQLGADILTVLSELKAKKPIQVSMRITTLISTLFGDYLFTTTDPSTFTFNGSN